MRKPARARGALAIFAMPLLLAGVTAFGLLSALLGDGVWDALSWAALGTPAAVALWHAARPARSGRRRGA